MGLKILTFHFFSGAEILHFFRSNAVAPFINERNALSVITNNNWSENNPDPYAFWPRLSTEIVENNNHNSTWWLRDGDFIRLKNIELGYTLPKELIGNNDLKTRFYLSGLNLFNYSSFDFRILKWLVMDWDIHPKELLMQDYN